MPDSSRLDFLRFTRRVVEQQAVAALRQIDGWIATEERHEQEARNAAARRPAPPEWQVELSIGRDRRPMLLHVGGCHMAKRAPAASRAEALRALADQVAACTHCRPDTALGWIG